MKTDGVLWAHRPSFAKVSAKNSSVGMWMIKINADAHQNDAQKGGCRLDGYKLLSNDLQRKRHRETLGNLGNFTVALLHLKA
jgi:hypothetical protein